MCTLCKPSNRPQLKLMQPSSQPILIKSNDLSKHSHLSLYSSSQLVIIDPPKYQSKHSSVPSASKLQKTDICLIQPRKDKSSIQKNKTNVQVSWQSKTVKGKSKNLCLSPHLSLKDSKQLFVMRKKLLKNQSLTVRILIQIRRILFLRKY